MARKFLEQFHAEELLEQAQPQRSLGQVAYLAGENEPLQGFAQSNRDRRAARGRRCGEQKIAAVEQDATLRESHPREALPTDPGERGYQPMLAVWAATDLLLADQFRDGNVPPMPDPWRVAQAALAALPETATELYYRGDAACHEQREDGPRECISFASSARRSPALRPAVEAVPKGEWQPYGNPDPAVRGERDSQKCVQRATGKTESYLRG